MGVGGKFGVGMINIKLIDNDSVALSTFNTIYLGRGYLKLPPPQRNAVMAHELAHIEGKHAFWRMVCLVFCFPLYGILCRHFEFVADKAVRRTGFGKALLDVLKPEFPGNWRYPSNAERRKRLIAWTPLKSTRIAGVTGKETYP